MFDVRMADEVGVDARAHPDDVGGLRRTWVVAFVADELVGFVPPAVAGAVSPLSECTPW